MKTYLNKIKALLMKEPDPAYKRRASLIFRHIDLHNKDKVLEIGCGRGFYVNNIALLFPSVKIWGVDLNDKYLSVARRNSKKNTIFLRANVTKLPFKKNFFDKIIASEILEHIPEDMIAIKEMYRVLKPGGIVLITVPNHKYPFFWDPINWILEKLFNKHLPSNIWWLSGIWADHIRLYRKSEILLKVKKSNFKVKNIWSTTRYCLPFSHFIFYGIGKNIVERGWMSNFDRFKNEKKWGLLHRIILAPIRIVDYFNKENEFAKPTVNLVLKVQKAQSS